MLCILSLFGGGCVDVVWCCICIGSSVDGRDCDDDVGWGNHAGGGNSIDGRDGDDNVGWNNHAGGGSSVDISGFGSNIGGDYDEGDGDDKRWRWG